MAPSNALVLFGCQASDHQDLALAEAVRKGRQAEFAPFVANASEIPDPQASQTFERSKLDWEERERGEHREIFEWYRQLIALRRCVPDFENGQLDLDAVAFDESARWIRIHRRESAVICNFAPTPQRIPIAPDASRYAMIALATEQERVFEPSLLEASADSEGRSSSQGGTKKSLEKPNYTIDTVKRVKQSLKRSDRLFLLIGIDAFADIGKWHESEALFRECEFVVASRPGFSLADVANALPPSLRPRQEVTRPFHKQAARGDLVLSGVTIHLLDQVYQPVSSTAIRQAVAAGKSLARFVEPTVADYIKKTGLYKSR